MGHYLTCRYYGIDASLPYFLPAPTLIGTFGAFIRIRSAIPDKRQLFDVGISGPLAGFLFVIPALAIGLAYSKIIPGIGSEGDFVFATPGIMRVLESWIMPGVVPSDILVHPVARAAWAGVLATALNLMPMGQLDGGHILYSFVGDHHKLLTRLFVFALLPLGYFSDTWSWIFWAALIFFFGMRHPRLYDNRPLGSGRVQLAVLALVIFVLSFCVSPVRT
jgi:membrane-associated protease RseP (regulator of RpoE activity)